jgi:hypothetical protein
MKRYKAIRLFAVVILIIAGTNLFAGENKEVKPFKEVFELNTLASLNSDNLGVAESSLFVTLELKDRYPGEDYSKVVNKLDELARDGSTLSIRYKAQLANIYYKYYYLFADISIGNAESPDMYFKIIADRIAQSSFVSN